MASYKAGIKTRDKIICTAKRLFYQKGYDVSVTEICKVAEIKLGTFTYHFKTKDTLIKCIYNEYMQKVWAYTDSVLQTADVVKLHMYAISLFYFNIYNDPNITAFQHGVYLQRSMNDILLEPKHIYECFFNQNDPAITAPYIYENLIIADNGSRRELNLRFIESHPDPKLDEILDLVRDVYFVTGRLMSFSTDRIFSYLDECHDFILDHLDSNVRLIP